MINNIALYLVPENIYLIANWGVVPLWLMVLLMPNHGLTKFFVNSVVVPILLGVAYIFLSYEIFLNENINYVTYFCFFIILFGVFISQELDKKTLKLFKREDI
mgnify:CR=1 FL=1